MGQPRKSATGPAGRAAVPHTHLALHLLVVHASHLLPRSFQIGMLWQAHKIIARTIAYILDPKMNASCRLGRFTGLQRVAQHLAPLKPFQPLSTAAACRSSELPEVLCAAACLAPPDPAPLPTVATPHHPYHNHHTRRPCHHRPVCSPMWPML